MNDASSASNRRWIAYVGISFDLPLNASMQRPDGRPGIQVRQLQDVLDISGEGFPPSCIMWQTCALREGDYACLLQFADRYPEIALFVFVPADMLEHDRLAMLPNVRLFSSHESKADVWRHMLAVPYDWQQRDLALYPGVMFKPDLRCLDKEGEVVPLTEKETEVLQYLLEHKGSFVTANALLQAIWDPFTTTDTVRQHIYRLRKKLRVPHAPASMILHRKGCGYMLVEEHTDTLLQLTSVR